MQNTMIVVIGLGVLGLLILMSLVARMFRKAGPNEALIKYGPVGRGSYVATERSCFR